jgi:excinuclease ABC subunit C
LSVAAAFCYHAGVNIPEAVREKLRGLPDKPGCYLMRDRRGKIVYVGKAVSLRKRVQSYFRDATLRRASPKLRGLIRSVADLDIIVVRNEAEAVLTEGRLIKEYRPYYNVSFRDDKRFLLLRADPDEPWPRFDLCRLRRDDRCLYFGPYASAAAARVTLDFIEKRFGLRKCTPRLPDNETYRHCINDIVRYCSAPCTGNISRAGYHERFEEACAFLRGQRLEYLDEVRGRMEEASRHLRFEEATALRDLLFHLHDTIRQHARVAATPEMRRDAALRGIEELQTVLALPSVPTLIEGFDVSTISGTHAVAAMVSAVDGLPRRNRYRRFRIRDVAQSDDPAMMAEAIRRRYARLLAEGGDLPGLVLVDGGITQLRAARHELDRLGLAQVPAAGLAKRYEEIYRPDAEQPLRLPRDSEALRVLQRLRDESHRFALTYHRRLRGRRIRESVLDEIPGIGPRRKQQLLAYFGSVRKLAAAGAGEIEQVPGVGPELASAIREALDR